MDAAAASVSAAYAANEQWKATTNEFRASLNDFALRSATVGQLDERVNPLRERLDKLERTAPTIEQVDLKINALATNVSKMETQVPAFVTLERLDSKLAPVIKDLDALKSTASAQVGRASGVQWVIGFIGFLITVAAFVLGYLALRPRP